MSAPSKLACFSWTIQSGQGLTTRSEPNAEHREVTNVRSRRKGGWSAITQVKVLSPEIVNIAQGQRFHSLETRIATCANGECAAACRGLSPWQVIQRNTTELGRAVPFPEEAPNKPVKVRRGYGGMAVGPTHSRGVGGVMPAEGESPLQGVGGWTQREGAVYAGH